MRQQLTIWISCGLLAAGLIIGSFATAQPQGGHRRTDMAYRMQPPRGPSEEDKEKARIRMGITKDQQRQIEEMFKQNEQKRQQIRARLGELYEQLRQVYRPYDYDHKKAKAIQHEIMIQRNRFFDLYAQNEDRLRKIMNRDQFRKMRALMDEGMEKWRREHPMGPGGPGGPRGPRPGGPGGMP